MRTRIESAGIPADLLPRVQRFAELLEERLEVFQSFEIEAVLSAETIPQHPSVTLSMGVRDNQGEMRWQNKSQLLPDVFVGSDANMRGWLDSTMSLFIGHVSKVYEENLRRKLDEIRLREPATLEV